ncbi:MAG TPA: type II toxin-antitoxin system VapC family toxin [Thermoanaerobaculia bacterium]|nr:type II toxin-antitoxin system VapC family toxin [Thermoanaerobaculia bacterium]
MILLDTHTWIWWSSAPAKLSKAARETLEQADELGVSAISCWELSMLVEKGRLQLDRDTLSWVREALSDESVILVPISPSIGVAAGSLGPDFHGDPADRLIVATALETGSLLVTKDGNIRSFPGVTTLW